MKTGEKKFCETGKGYLSKCMYTLAEDTGGL